MSINRVILIGTLGSDPIKIDTESGNTLTKLSLATPYRSRVKGEEGYEYHTDWHRVVLFGKKAESAANYLGKGSKVGIIGRLKNRKFTDKTGHDREISEIIADEVTFLSKKNQSGSDNHTDVLNDMMHIAD